MHTYRIKKGDFRKKKEPKKYFGGRAGERDSNDMRTGGWMIFVQSRDRGELDDRLGPERVDDGIYLNEARKGIRGRLSWRR